jgi:cytoplasmic iron level regulating protein YaaA (DUF328/UPF0246 family)
MKILIHSSKSMLDDSTSRHISIPVFINDVVKLNSGLKDLSIGQLMKEMKISEKLAEQVKHNIDNWSAGTNLVPAIEAFRGDIYSGVRASTIKEQDKEYAQDHLVILSGLYGALKPYDGIRPYRFEMGYKHPKTGESMYKYWGGRLAGYINEDKLIINVSSKEYTKAVLPYMTNDVRVVTPKFMTISPGSGEPKFVTVHAKIARGAYARWLIDTMATDKTDLTGFNRLGYRYDKTISTKNEPVFVCSSFEGKGLSVRLEK